MAHDARFRQVARIRAQHSVAEVIEKARASLESDDAKRFRSYPHLPPVESLHERNLTYRGASRQFIVPQGEGGSWIIKLK